MSKTKKIELKAKKLILGSLTPENSTHITNAEKVFQGPLKILLLRQDRLGDLLISTQFISELKKLLPSSKIDILLSTKNSSLIDLVDGIDDHYIYNKKILDSSGLVLKLRKKKYDLVIDLFDNPSTTSQTLIKLISPKNTLGFKFNNENIYNYTVDILPKDKTHIIKRVNQLLLAFGKENDLEPKVILPKKETQRNDSIGIVIAGSGRSKFLGVEKLIELINSLKEKGSNLTLINSPGFDNEAKMIIEACQIPLQETASSLKEFAYSLINYKIIITPDTSVVHFCSGFQIPCIAYFKVKDVKKYGMPWLPVNTKYEYIKTSSHVSEISVELLVKKSVELENTLKLY